MPPATRSAAADRPTSPDAPDPQAPAGGPLLRRLRRLPGLGLAVQAAEHYVQHQSASLAGSIAFSMVLSMFPLLILVASSAAFFGDPAKAGQLVARVLEYTPPLVRESLQASINDVLRHRSEALVTVGFLGTLWAASSGLQAVRTGVNRAYGVSRGLAFWKARLKVTLFTVVVGLGTLATFSSVVVMPAVARLIAATADTPQQALWLGNAARLGSAFAVLVVVYALVYAWLPDLPQRLGTVLPGALVGPALWLVAAQLLNHAMRAAGKLLLVYGSFAGVVALLVFLYASAATLLYGAELNGVLRERSRRA
jgi:membrane protein